MMDQRKGIVQGTDGCGLMDESTCTRDIVLISASKESPATFDSLIAKNCTDNQSSEAQAVVSDEFDSKEKTINDGQAYQESDSDDDFFSVRGEFPPSCSNGSSRQWSLEASPQLKKTYDSEQENYLQEPFSRDSTDDQESALPVYKEVKLTEFFQDRHWQGEVASIQSSSPIAPLTKEYGIRDLPQNGISSMPRQSSMFNLKNGNSDLESKNKATVTHCCMPSWSPRRSSRERRKPRRTEM